MTTTAPTTPAARPAVGTDVPWPRQMRHVLSGEWIKARSLASTWSALGATTFIMVAIGVILSNGVGSSDGGAAVEPVDQIFGGVAMSQVALGVLGALLVTTEYTSRSIVTTLAAVPQRATLLAAKGLLLVLITAPAALAGTAGAVAGGLAVLRGDGADISWTTPGLVRATLGTAATLMLTALIGLAIGTLLRTTVSAVIVIVFVNFLIPVLVGLLPAVQDSVGPWLPSQAGGAVQQISDRSGFLPPLAGLGLLAAYTAAALTAAAVRLRRRDA